MLAAAAFFVVDACRSAKKKKKKGTTMTMLAARQVRDAAAYSSVRSCPVFEYADDAHCEGARTALQHVPHSAR